ncbi:MAG: PilZ domain-containing protein [Oligoflexia bacterium]|nr:PilZ domain-containing protein [Oligoflexia bacterium]
MADRSNIIPFTGKKTKKQDPKLEKLKAGLEPSDTPIDLSARRDLAKQNDRRQVTRTVLSQFIGVFVVLKDVGLQPVSLYDISEDGLAFDLNQELGSFTIGETITMRIYLSHDMYFSFNVKVANMRSILGEAVNRHGAKVLRSSESYDAIQHFMKFLEAVASVAKKDHGDRVVSRTT